MSDPQAPTSPPVTEVSRTGSSKSRFRRQQNALLAAILAVLVLALLFIDFDPPATDPPEAIDRYPDAYLFDMESREFNQEGRTHYTVRAFSALYYSGEPRPDGHAVFSRPRLTFYGEGRPPWQLRADTGRGDPGGERLSLSSNVRLWQAEGDTDIAELLTEELHINLRARYAETGKTVTMRSEQSLTTAVGLRAFLDTEVVELLSEVESIYEP